MAKESKIILGLSILFFIVIIKMCSSEDSSKKKQYYQSNKINKKISQNHIIKKRGSSKSSLKKVIIMKNSGGVYMIPCRVNGVELDFIFDTGASDVSLSIVEANFLYKKGLLNDEDFRGTQNYITASGEIVENTQVILREIEISGLKLFNVKASISSQVAAPLLLGQSAIQKLGKIQIEGNKLTIIR
jgi:clan AA aspartic protease (TIGR02281 family)